MKIRIVLPAYNEEESLPSLLLRIDAFSKVSKLPLEVLVINDGSTDNTLQLVKDFEGNIPVNYFDVQPNQGLANALRTGFREGLKGLEERDILVTMDADDSQNPYLIEQMAWLILQGSELVIASRYQHGARIKGLTLFRRFASWVAGTLFRIIVRMEGVRDYTCGFRAYQAGFLRQVSNYYGDRLIEQKGFGCMAEVLIKTNRFRPVANEVPMILRYDQKQGASKMNVNSTIFQTLKLLADYAFGKIK